MILMEEVKSRCVEDLFEDRVGRSLLIIGLFPPETEESTLSIRF